MTFRSNNAVQTSRPASKTCGASGMHDIQCSRLTTKLKIILEVRFSKAFDVFHHPQVNCAKNVVRPPIEIPRRPHLQRIPGPPDQGGCAIAIVPQFELAAPGIQMTDQLRISWHLDDLKRQQP